MDNLVSPLSSDPSANEGEGRYRPSLHFAPKRNWMNDPNGLVYYEGEYHLFFQHNPFGDQWGHMSWGHAVSRDLVHWEELPVAIPKTEKEMIFSGCTVIDWKNVSGLGRGDEPPMLAFYTGFDAAADVQRQCLAYSLDRGRTFTFYDGNPLIDLGMAHFRDPKVFYHKPSAAWVMVVALPRVHKVQFYRSTNLLDWKLAGSFGSAGATSGQWECPDLMLVPLEHEPSRARWVLKVDVDAGFVGGGSGAQYFIGEFDGYNFTIDPVAGSPNGDTVDFGPDFYAAVTWSDLPPEQPGPLWIGWMSNHQTGRFYPTKPWRGAQSLPRTLFLFEETGKLKLGQRPVAAAAEIFDAKRHQLEADKSGTASPNPQSFRARLNLKASIGRSGTLQLLSGDEALVTLVYDREKGLRFTREGHDQAIGTSLRFEASSPYEAGEQIAVDLYFDSCLLEVFVDGGRRVFSSCAFGQRPEKACVRVD